jgi:hypothetical protein
MEIAIEEKGKQRIKILRKPARMKTAPAERRPAGMEMEEAVPLAYVVGSYGGGVEAEVGSSLLEGFSSWLLLLSAGRARQRLI